MATEAPLPVNVGSGKKRVQPTEVSGVWSRRKALLQAALMGFFLVLPWLRVNGKPALLLNIVERKFSVAGILFRAHDVPILFLVILVFLLSFALLTALYGRVWCGWACPQTVFIEAVFRRIERWIEGGAVQRRRAQELPWFETIGKKTLKWFVFTLIALVISHSLLALFVGTDRMAEMIAAGPGTSPGAFTFMALATAILLFDFGWFREQFCIYICPYGRIQSVLQDRKTVTVSYDERRGEPRGKKSAASQKSLGDCVDCLRCVKVCPTGIDIRNGPSQLECIACTACMDACDDVMGRLGRERGLIRYASEAELKEGEKPRRRRVTGRPLMYGLFLLLAVSGLWTVLAKREIAGIEIFKTRGAPFIEVSDSPLNFANLFMAEMTNQSDGPAEVNFALVGESTEGIELVMPNHRVTLAPGEMLRNPFTIRFAKNRLTLGKGKASIRVTVREISEAGRREGRSEEKTQEVTLVGPF